MTEPSVDTQERIDALEEQLARKDETIRAMGETQGELISNLSVLQRRIDALEERVEALE